jgi:tetratricopeptide (TPR) repeat protein
LFATLAGRRGARMAGVVAALVMIVFAARTVTRIPVWRDNRALLLASILAHPESYKVHQSAARVHVQRADTAAAVRAYGVAVELFPLDNYLLTEVGALEIETGRVHRAIGTLRRAASLNGRYAQTQELLARALLLADSGPAALAVARRAVAVGPTRPGAARMLAASWIRLRNADSALAVWPDFARRGGRRFERWLYAASTWAALDSAAQARRALDSALVELPRDSLVFAQLREAQQILAAARLR